MNVCLDMSHSVDLPLDTKHPANEMLAANLGVHLVLLVLCSICAALLNYVYSHSLTGEFGMNHEISSIGLQTLTRSKLFSAVKHTPGDRYAGLDSRFASP